MNRKSWESWEKRNFTKTDPPQYQCPKCQIGFLKIEEIVLKKTEGGKELERIRYPYGIEHLMAGVFKCRKESCGEIVSFSGLCTKDIHVQQEVDGEMVEFEADMYEPKYFYPNLKLFELPKEVSAEVEEQINLSFSHFFNDLSSSANKVRTAIEFILDDVKAPKFKFKIKAGNKKRVYFRTLHGRIVNYKTKRRKVSDLLLAIKFIGNEGSHVGKVELKDILDAYELLYQVIDIIYVKKQQKILEIAKEINEKKKPRSKH